jgi:hypothetical protein
MSEEVSRKQVSFSQKSIIEREIKYFTPAFKRFSHFYSFSEKFLSLLMMVNFYKAEDAHPAAERRAEGNPGPAARDPFA